MRDSKNPSNHDDLQTSVDPQVEKHDDDIFTSLGKDEVNARVNLISLAKEMWGLSAARRIWDVVRLPQVMSEPSPVFPNQLNQINEFIEECFWVSGDQQAEVLTSDIWYLYQHWTAYTTRPRLEQRKFFVELQNASLSPFEGADGTLHRFSVCHGTGKFCGLTIRQNWVFKGLAASEI